MSGLYSAGDWTWVFMNARQAICHPSYTLVPVLLLLFPVLRRGLSEYLSLAFNVWQSTCLNLPGAGTTGKGHQAQPQFEVLFP